MSDDDTKGNRACHGTLGAGQHLPIGCRLELQPTEIPSVRGTSEDGLSHMFSFGCVLGSDYDLQSEQR